MATIEGGDEALPLSEYRLPPGRHGLPREEVEENQRWRLIGAAGEVLAEEGHLRTTSTRVSRRAGVSPATFYEHFENIEACLFAAFQAEMDAVVRTVADACEQTDVGWRERLGLAVASTLRFLAVEPSMAHMLGAEAAAGVAAIAAAREEAIERLAELLARGRSLRPSDAPTLPPGTERHLVSAALTTVARWIDAGDVERLPELTSELAHMLAVPYGEGDGA